MTFTMVASRYAFVVPLVKLAIPQFVLSEEYKAIGEVMDDLPGVVVAGFAKYILREFSTGRNVEELRIYVSVLSILHSWRDSQVDQMLIEETFEILVESEEMLCLIAPLMSIGLRDMFNNWRQSAQ